jgi:hypothetical protein
VRYHKLQPEGACQTHQTLREHVTVDEVVPQLNAEVQTRPLNAWVFPQSSHLLRVPLEESDRISDLGREVIKGTPTD